MEVAKQMLRLSALQGLQQGQGIHQGQQQGLQQGKGIHQGQGLKQGQEICCPPKCQAKVTVNGVCFHT